MEVVKGPDSSPEERINRLIKDYERDLLRLCCVYLRDVSLAEDAVQETFIKAYRGLRTFRGESGEKTWLYRIAINVCKDMRRGSWFRFVSRDVNLDELQIPDSGRGERSALVEEIMRLPRKYREVILLYYYEDMKLAEIAKAIGVSAMTVSRRIDKARSLLKDLLEGGDFLEE